jgi:hypothetical protein
MSELYLQFAGFIAVTEVEDKKGNQHDSYNTLD